VLSAGPAENETKEAVTDAFCPFRVHGFCGRLTDVIVLLEQLIIQKVKNLCLYRIIKIFRICTKAHH
jgi:hypothetical protein